MLWLSQVFESLKIADTLEISKDLKVHGNMFSFAGTNSFRVITEATNIDILFDI
jgi:hypothetical protein